MLAVIINVLDKKEEPALVGGGGKPADSRRYFLCFRHVKIGLRLKGEGGKFSLNPYYFLKAVIFQLDKMG